MGGWNSYEGLDPNTWPQSVWLVCKCEQQCWYNSHLVPMRARDITTSPSYPGLWQSLAAPSLHHHYSCSQSWYRSPTTKQAALRNHKRPAWSGISYRINQTDLQEHVARLNASVSSHCTTLHDGADVDSSIALLVTLPDYTNAQKIILLYSEVERETRWEMNG